VDRGFVYTKVPAAYSGTPALRTANNDKNATSDSFLSFDVSQPVTVVVGHDLRITSKPRWLSGWTRTGERLVTNDTTLELFRKDFAAGKVTLGGNAGPSSSSMYTVFLATPKALPKEPEKPTQQQASTAQGTAVTVKVSGESQPTSLRIVSAPSHGTATANSDGTITYQPKGDYTGSDTVHYELKNPDGSITLASLVITVTCHDCSSDTILHLAWDPNPPAEKVQGYRVYFGSTASEAKKEVANLSVAKASFDASAPSVKFNAWDDIRAKAGQTVCFRVTAYNAVGMSDFSEAACTKL
ncbi:MAG: Ig-like domain-containing protein, partial [Gammaproteobacteria bacterium]